MSDLPHILVVDDESRAVELLVRTLRKVGRIETAHSGADGWCRVQERDFDLVISDQRMPGMSGVDFLGRVAEHREDTGRILLTGYSDLEATVAAINRGRVHAYVHKPCSPDDLLLVVRGVLERVRLRRENRSLVGQLQTQNARLEEALSSLGQAQERALASERLAAIGQMIAMIVHDLRGPLTVIRSAAAEIGHAEDLADAGRLAGDALAEADLMERMCSDLLEVSRASRGEVQTRAEDLDELVASALAHVVEAASHQGVQVRLDLASRLTLEVDEDRLRRALRNLAQNALEAMPDGGLLHVKTGRDGEGAVVAVSDSGPGIPREIAESLFEPFVTAGKARGSGLGLAIVRKAVEDHGGRIEVEKSEAGGARFVLHLPLPAPGAS